MRNAAELAVVLLLSVAPPAPAHEGHHRHEEPAAAAAAPAQRAAVPEAALVARHLRMPEYLHVLLNPIPPLGMSAGAVLLVASPLLPAALEPGLVLVAVSGAATAPTVLLGQKGYDRLFDSLEPEAQRWLDVHMARAEKAQWLFYAAALLALAALIAGRRRSKAAAGLRASAFVAAALSAAAAAWIAHAGGQAVHPEFREGPPTAAALDIVPPAERAQEAK